MSDYPSMSHVQHITFEGNDCVVMSPEEYGAALADLEAKDYELSALRAELTEARRERDEFCAIVADRTEEISSLEFQLTQATAAAAVPDDVAKDAIGKIDQNSYTTGWNDCAQQIGDDRMPGIRYTAEYLRERVNTMRIKGLSMSVMMSPTIWQQRLRGSFRSPRPASVTPRCTIPSCSPPTPRAAKMRNRIAIIAISAAVLSGCGWFDRKLSALTGEASKVCVDGVTYLQFTSGATVQLDRAGLPVACN